MASGNDFVKGRELQKEEYFEVLFKHYHVMHFPWGENMEKVEHFSQFLEVPLQNKTVAVTKLCHFTHDEQAKGIKQSGEAGCYVFKPKAKHGKGPPRRRKSYVIHEATKVPPNYDTLYEHVCAKEEVFPGFLSWWSIDIDESSRFCYDSEELQKATGSYYITNDFMDPPRSNYGNVMFSVNLSHLLQNYQKAFEKIYKRLPKISLRCGGTLRYQKEIMKVIIVCCIDHELADYPILNTPGFSLEYDDNGKVSTNGSLTLTINNGIKACRPSESKPYHRYSWDTYGFALYFPNQDLELKCNCDDVMIDNDVEHEKVVGETTFGRCTKRVLDSDGQLICPSKKRKLNDEDWLF